MLPASAAENLKMAYPEVFRRLQELWILRVAQVVFFLSARLTADASFVKRTALGLVSYAASYEKHSSTRRWSQFQARICLLSYTELTFCP